MITARPLTQGDLPALLELLTPVEASSVFLVSNATQGGLDDRGEAHQGVWLGAFDGDHIRGALAWIRGPDSLTPACGGHADVLVPAMLERLAAAPRVVVGTSERVREVLDRLPPTWCVSKRQRDTLMTLSWDRYRAPDDRRATELPPERALEAAALIGLLHREWGLPTDDARNLETAGRGAREGRVVVREHEGRAVAMSCEAASTARYVHVGATACEPAHRRRGHARACVAAVLERARARGRAAAGATLFTGEDNRGAIALYESMGFAVDGPWDLCFLRAG